MKSSVNQTKCTFEALRREKPPSLKVRMTVMNDCQDRKIKTDISLTTGMLAFSFFFYMLHRKPYFSFS